MDVTVSRLVVEHHRAPLGIGEDRPRLSWHTHAGAAWRQTGYEIEVTREGASSIHHVTSAEQVLVPWPDRPLQSRERCRVRVRVHDERTTSAWSPTLTVEAGLLHPSDWVAQPVGAGWPEATESDTRRPALVRREFTLSAPADCARLYVSAHGLYEAEINGVRVGDDALSPGWTSYRTRLRYYTYDVTELLVVGDNTIGAWLGDGWYRGRLGWKGGFRNLFGSDQSLLAQLEVTMRGGGRVTVATDSSWRAGTGPILAAGNYDGEDYDATQERPGWSRPGVDDTGWTPVGVHERNPATLVAPTGPPVRCTQELQPVAVLDTPSGKQVIDFGQNISGRPRLRVPASATQLITVRTAEVMQEGEIYTRPLRSARSADTFRPAKRAQTYEPRFTMHGFRYLEVTGWPGDVRAAAGAGDITARVYHSDMRRTGWFTCSDDRINRLHENVVWSMRSNFVDLPTDCPQRDERVGWTGDIQIFAPTAAFLYDCSGFLTSWLRDLTAEQLPDGTVPWYVPNIPAHERWTPIRPGAAWGDVAVLTPWLLYQRYGDHGLLADQYPTARRWVELLDHLSGPQHLWNKGFQLGDWLDPDAPPDDPAAGKTDKYLVATAYFFASTATLARMADTLGHHEDARHYGALAEQIRQAFIAEYVLPDGTMASDAQTAYALAITFDLVTDPGLRAAAGQRLAELVRKAHNRISTGFVGTPLLTDALTATGQLATAYDLLTETECPSWLYPVTQGATTIWERWDSLMPNGRVNPGSMTSFNHYALGAVADWLHRVVAGLAPAAPGYRRIRFQPRPGGGLRHASARLESPYGEIAISWCLDGGSLMVDTVVPTGTTAVLDLPGRPEQDLAAGQHHTEVPVVH